MSRYAYDKDTKQSSLIAGVGTGQAGILPHLIIISEAGSDVTVTKGQTVIVALETSTGHFECDVPEYGTYQIDAVLAGDDARVNLVVDDVKIYTVDDSHFHADITVTYPAGATVSCSKSGETTMYATGSPYTFTVHSSGTWTITGALNGVTITENVTINTSGQTESVYFQNTIEVDLYSAASDTVSFTDETGSKTATTDSTGKAEGVSITYSRFKNNAIQFTSSVAKNPSDLTADYTKLIYLDENTTEVYVMPEEALYWYGYKESDLVDCSTDGWSDANFTYQAATFNTNSIGLSPSAYENVKGVSSHTTSRAEKAHAIVNATLLASSGDGTIAGFYPAKSHSGGDKMPSYKVGVQHLFANNSDTSVGKYVSALTVRNTRAGEAYALWTKSSSDYNFFSAANDTVTYKDSNNNDVVFAITDEDGYAKVDYSAIPSGTYTLYSSVAKDPDNLSNAYSKTVTISNATTSVYIMPVNSNIYWYGFADGVEDCTVANGWNSQVSTISPPTSNTNNKILTHPLTTDTCAIGIPTSKSSGNLHTIGYVTGSSAEIEILDAKSNLASGSIQTVATLTSSNSHMFGEISQTGYPIVIVYGDTGNATIYAFWLE